MADHYERSAEFVDIMLAAHWSDVLYSLATLAAGSTRLPQAAS